MRRVEAASRVFGRKSKWILFASLGLASYIYSLDASTTSSYLSFAASEFGEHAMISALLVAQSVIGVFPIAGSLEKQSLLDSLYCDA